jgi:acyl-CoA thioester hydrolase
VHETRLQTRWTDFDALGHVTHASYPVYFDEARDRFLVGKLGPFEEFSWVVAHISIDFRREIRHPTEEVVVRTWIDDVGTKSMTLGQQVLAPDGEAAAEGRAVLVAWDAERRGSRALTDDERARLA